MHLGLGSGGTAEPAKWLSEGGVGWGDLSLLGRGGGFESQALLCFRRKNGCMSIVRAGDVVQLAECLPSKYKALGSNSSLL